MKKGIFVFIFAIFLSSVSYSSDKYPLAMHEDVATLFMETSEITLKKTGVKPGTLAQILYKLPFAEKWNPKLLHLRNARKRLAAVKAKYYRLGANPKNIKLMLATNIIDEGDTWELAKLRLANVASHGYIDEYAGKTDINALALNRKLENYYDEFMLSNLEWFRDGRGNLHIPSFLKEKYDSMMKEGENEKY